MPTQVKTNRYQAGLKTLKPDLVRRLQQLMEGEPGLSKSELARRAGVTRQTVVLYFKRMGDDLVEQATKKEEIRERAVLNQLHLVEQVAEAVDDVREEIGKLRHDGSPSPTTSNAVFRGFGALERLLRLWAELAGKISPSQVQQNTLVMMQAFVNREVPVTALSPTSQAALGVQRDNAG